MVCHVLLVLDQNRTLKTIQKNYGQNIELYFLIVCPLQTSSLVPMVQAVHQSKGWACISREGLGRTASTVYILTYASHISPATWVPCTSQAGVILWGGCATTSAGMLNLSEMRCQVSPPGCWNSQYFVNSWVGHDMVNGGLGDWRRISLWRDQCQTAGFIHGEFFRKGEDIYWFCHFRRWDKGASSVTFLTLLLLPSPPCVFFSFLLSLVSSSPLPEW